MHCFIIYLCTAESQTTHFIYSQVELFCKRMMKNKYHVKGRSLINMPIERMKLPWYNDVNKVACGVCAIRHMETYMGQMVKDWNIRLNAD